MSYKPKVLTASEGGLGVSSNTAYAVLCGGTTSTSAIQSVASVGSLGDVLTSNGASALPSFQPLSGLLGYTIIKSGISSNPADSAVYAISCGINLTSTYSGTSTISQKTYVPIAGTIKQYIGVFIVDGALGSTESVTLSLYVNDVNQATISTFNLSTASVATNNTSMSVAVTAGDYVTIVMTCPAWTTNPTIVSASGTIYIT